MSYEKHCRVIDELCLIIAHPRPRQLYENANITAFGTSFSLMYGGAAAPDRCVVFCDFGPLPDHPADVASFEFVKLLLVANVDMVNTLERGGLASTPPPATSCFPACCP